MEQVPAQQHKVRIVVGRYLEHLLKRNERVVLANLVLLPHALRGGRGAEGAAADGWAPAIVWGGQGRWPACHRRKQSRHPPRTKWLSVETRMRRMSSLQAAGRKGWASQAAAQAACGDLFRGASRLLAASQSCSAASTMHALAQASPWRVPWGA